MRRYSLTNPPPAEVWWTAFRHAQSKGVGAIASQAYATLAWWGEHLGIRSPRIVSGLRSAAAQAALQARWDRGDRSGLIVRPASNSSHTRGEAFDLERGPHLAQFGEWAPYVGLRWGGKFSTPDPVHFDLGRA